MTKPKVAKPKTLVVDVSVYVRENGEMFVERDDGTMSLALSGAEAMAAIKKDAERLAKRKRACVITRVTWQPAFVTASPDAP